MPSPPTDIVKFHLEHLTRRLTSRSPLLRFQPTENGRILDIHTFYTKNTPDAKDLFPTDGDKPDRIMGERHEVNKDPFPTDSDKSGSKALNMLRQLLDPEGKVVEIEHQDVGEKVYAKCLKSMENNRDYQNQTGNWALYLGYPFLFWKKKENPDRPFWSPLFFWKIEITKGRKNNLMIKRRKNLDEPEPPMFNHFLAALVKKHTGMEISFDEEANISVDDMKDRVEGILGNWGDCNRNTFSDNLLPFVKSPSSEVETSAVYPYAAIGYGEFKNQSIFEDLRKLSEKLEDNEDTKNLGCLDLLIKARRSETNRPDNPPKEQDKITIAETDASQERAVWRARESRLTILQGPPGTGKSQTIVNLIADALEKRESVAVVCHHDAALNVVMKRLQEKGLKDLAIKINDPRSDRKRIITNIKEIKEEVRHLFSISNGSCRDRVCQQIEELEISADALYSKIKGKEGESSYGNLSTRADEISKKWEIRIHLPQYQSFREKQIFSEPENICKAKEQTRKIEEHVKHHELCDFDNSYWKKINDREEIREAELYQILEHLIDKCSSIVNTASLHDDRDEWFAEHPLMVKHYPYLVNDLNTQEKFAELVCESLNALSRFLPPTIIYELCRDHKTNGDSNAFKKCCGQIETIASVLRVREDKANDRLIRIFYESAEHGISDEQKEKWQHYYLAAVIWNLLRNRNINNRDIQRIESNREKLKENLKTKRESDLEHVLNGFNERVLARNDLQQANLLKLHGGPKGKKTALRDIYHKRFKKISDIYPVLLISPDAACQMLPLEPNLFDRLIIDEASQVFTSDALSLLYRAKKVVISGDDQQMPPSKHFMFKDEEFDERDEEEEIEETPNPNRLIPAEGEVELLAAAENVLQTGSLDRKLLNVHYRSVSRKLIDFSNHAFYKGELEIPPGNGISRKFMDQPISLCEVKNGKFEDGVNKPEIKRIIDELKNIWQRSGDKPSIGVIVFNTTQRDILLDAIEREDDPNFKRHLNESRKLVRDDRDESFFVRSVEHVQGDERDIIILATTYGRGPRRYGPINEAKGRRRLNVAITRAKHGMIVITSLDIDQISNRGESPGNDGYQNETERWFFWMYMRYARAVSNNDEKEIKAILGEIDNSVNAREKPSTGDPDTFFEESVGEFLKSEGFRIEYQIGESGFRIDIGVKKSDDDRDYLCGIECDGPPYHSHWRARYRDIWRQDILESRGWKIIRVWGAKWSSTNQAAKKELLEEIKNI